MTNDVAMNSPQDRTEFQKNTQPIELTKHVCTVCNRRFARREHLMRHGRIHTKEAPFGCDICGQHFRRQDVFRRHLIGVCGVPSDSQNQSRPHSQLGSMGSRRQRAPRACNQCRAQKLKCDGATPCRRCASLSRPCMYRPFRNNRPVAAPASSEETQTQTQTQTQTRSRSVSPSPTGDNDDENDNVDDNNNNNHSPQQAIRHPQTTQMPEMSEMSELPEMADMGQCPPQAALEPHLGQQRVEIQAVIDTNSTPSQAQQVPIFPWETVHLHANAVPPFPVPDGQFNEALDFAFLGSPDDITTSYPFFLSFDSENEASLADFQPSPWIFPTQIFGTQGEHQRDSSGMNLGMNPSINPDINQLAPLPPTKTGQRQNQSQSRPHRDVPDVPTWLHKLPSTVHPHDPHIVRAFVDEFLANMDQAFPTFKNLRIHNDTLPDLVLAMAAVGGLFSKVEGSFRVAMSMYTDARRLASGRVYSQKCTSDRQYLDLIQTMIAIEVFGFYSGDARSMECSEACHRHLLQVLDDSAFLSRNPETSTGKETERLEILTSIYTLEAYYVVLLSRAPCLYGHSLVGKTGKIEMLEQRPKSFGDGQGNDKGGNVPLKAFSDMFRSTVNPATPFVASPSPSSSSSFSIFMLSSLCSLSALATLSWHARPRKHQSRQGPLSLWSQDHVELALHRWLQSRPSETAKTEAALSTTILFHMTYISLHIDMDFVHQYIAAQLRFSQPTTSARSSSNGANGADERLERLLNWTSRTNSRTAILHATALLDVAKSLLVFGPYGLWPHANRPNSDAHALGSCRPAEAPHISICIYSASVILWVASIIRQNMQNTQRHRGGHDSIQHDSRYTSDKSNTHLEGGINLLSRLDSRMARKLCRTLVRLHTSELPV